MRLPQDPAREALAVWALTLAGLAAAQAAAAALPVLGGAAGALAVAAFLWVPARVLERRRQEPADAGLTLAGWRKDLAWGLGACLLVLPAFTLAWLWFARAVPGLPPGLRGLVAPYLSPPHPLDFRLPAGWEARLDLLGRVGGNGAVAIAEEFFYRGYLTLRLEERWPARARVLGAPLGRAALLAAALFALGHLLVPAPWRLAVFFPALLFAWLRARTGTVAGAALCHWLCNVWLLLLERAAW